MVTRIIRFGHPFALGCAVGLGAWAVNGGPSDVFACAVGLWLLLAGLRVFSTVQP